MSETLQLMVDRMAKLPIPVQEQLAQRFLRELDEVLQARSEKITRPDVSPLPVRFEDIEHLLGVFDGPGDLSTNKTYLDDLGESSPR